MIVLLVLLLSAIPVAVCGYVGSRLGGRRMSALLLAGLAGAAVGIGGVHWGWSVPFGLLTPAVAALLATGAGCWLASRRAPGARGRRIGAGIGALCGVGVAGALWIAASLGDGIANEPERVAAANGSWTHALVRTANRGFVRHLPLLGPLGDEVEATIAILNAPLEARRELARGRNWERLTRLESYRQLAEDEAVGADLASFRDGSLLALYRLQRNPRIVAFVQEEEVRALLPFLRPSVLAAELERQER